MKQKIIVIVLVVLMVILLVGCTSCNFPVINTYKNITTSSMSMKYDIFNEHKTTNLSLKENEIVDVNMNIVSKSGKLSVSIVNEDNETIYQGIDIPTSSFAVTLNKKGKYQINIDGEKHKGSFHIFWKRTNDTKEESPNRISKFPN